MFVTASTLIAQPSSNGKIAIPINSGWEFRQTTTGDTANAGEWHPAVVPGDVHLDLLRNKLIPNPYYRENEAKLQWIENASWEYRTTIDGTPELLKHRFGIVNVWRPIRGPVLDSPLALCDARTFTDDDLIASDLVYPHVRGETSSVEYKPGHRWYYFSEMQPDEAVLIRVHDSANDGRARLSFHTSFDNPLAPDAPPRESIEVRSLVFFPPNA